MFFYIFIVIIFILFLYSSIKSCASFSLFASTDNLMHFSVFDGLINTHLSSLGMIFIPSTQGISHNENEFSSEQDIAAGMDVLMKVLLELSG